jgi:hypothetical protein
MVFKSLLENPRMGRLLSEKQVFDDSGVKSKKSDKSSFWEMCTYYPAIVLWAREESRI